jgi:hypothetical protein
MNGQFHPDEIIRLSEEYSSPRSAIIRAHIVMGVTRYFLERWVPLLGPATATVINTLRQLNYHTPDEPITISGGALAREAAMSRRHLYTCLETPWLQAFLRIIPGQRVRAETGKVVQETNRYQIRMDDPLNPADAEHLLAYLKTLGDNPLEAVRKATERSGRELWASDARQTSTDFPSSAPIHALNVLRRAFPNWQPADKLERLAFAQAAETLHDHVTLVRGDGRTSKIIVPQYFRQRWWKHLGHDLAWSYLWFRGIVYHNMDEGVARHVCWISSLDDILSIIDRPYEWWRRNVEHAKRKNGSTIADFFWQIDTDKGRDPAHPQRVARQFEVRLDLPISPDDRSRYSALLIDWPEPEEEDDLDVEQGAVEISQPADTTVTHSDVAHESEPLAHVNTGVPHKQTQPSTKPPTHLNTPESQESHTFRHTQIPTLSHISTHSSTTNVHRESKHLKQAPLKTSTKSNSKHTKGTSDTPTATNAAAAKSYVIQSPRTLTGQLAYALQATPQVPLWQAAPATIWLEGVWDTPIPPHTPAWRIVTSKQVTVHELVALILAVWADSTVESPPLYLSWLMKQWLSNPEYPPISHWTRWRALAALPLAQWNTEGRREWLELTDKDNRTLPFGLDILFDVSQTVQQDNDPPVRDIAWYHKRKAEQDAAAGLSQTLGEKALTIRDVWRVALGQLRAQLGTNTYVNWVEGAHPVSFHDGVLTVQARHALARKYLAERYNHTIEEMVSSLAQTPITIRYVEPNADRSSR